MAPGSADPKNETDERADEAMSVYEHPLTLEPQPEGGYVVKSPLLPELVTEGETVEDAIRNANDALEALIEGFETLGRPLPGAFPTRLTTG